VLDQYVHEIQVSCLPADLPVSITVNITALQLNESLHLGDIVLPARVKAVGDMEQVVFHVGLPKVKIEVEKTATETAEGTAEAGKADDKAAAEGADAKAAPAKDKKD